MSKADDAAMKEQETECMRSFVISVEWMGQLSIDGVAYR